jgi:hypothetical protein
VAPFAARAFWFVVSVAFAIWLVFLAFVLAFRTLPSCFMRLRLVFWPSRWHPRYAFVLQASPLCGATLEWQTP